MGASLNALRLANALATMASDARPDAQWVLVCSYGAEALRLQRPHGAGPGHSSKAERLRARADLWTAAVAERGAETPAVAAAAPGADDAKNAACMFEGLALLEPGQTWDPLLSRIAWSQFAQKQREYYHRAEDAYTVKVLRTWRALAPAQIFFRDGRRGMTRVQLREANMVFRPWTSLGDAPLSPADGSGGESPGQQILVADVVGGVAAAARLLALQLPSPVVRGLLDPSRRCGSGGGSEAVALARWCRPRLAWPTFPPARWAKAAAGLHDAVVEHFLHEDSTRKVRDLADATAEWSPAILAAAPQHEERQCRSKLIAAVQLLDKLGAAAHQPEERRRYRRWDSHSLIKLFRAASLLKDMSHLSHIIRCLQSCSLATSSPGAAPKDQQGAHVPGTSTLKRMAFHVDVAAMLYEKRCKAAQVAAAGPATRQLQRPWAIYGWADASPQGWDPDKTLNPKKP